MSTALLERHRADVADLVRLAERDLMLLLEPVAEAAATRDLLIAALPDLVSVYGAASATLAAEFYDELRDAAEVPGRFSASPAALPDVSRTDALARWAATPLFSDDPDPAAVAARATGGLQRTVADADRHTVMGSSIADPAAQGWKRMTSAKACGFCLMLAGRGVAYTRSSVDFGAHDHCGCIAVPGFGGDVRSARSFERSTRKVSESQRAATKRWMAEHGY